MLNHQIKSLLFIEYQRIIFIQQTLFRDGEFFKYGSFDHSTKVCVRVPFLLKNHFSLRMVGDKIGVVRLNLKESKIDYLNFEFEDDEDPMGKKIDIEPIVSFVYASELSSVH